MPPRVLCPDGRLEVPANNSGSRAPEKHPPQGRCSAGLGTRLVVTIRTPRSGTKQTIGNAAAEKRAVRASDARATPAERG